jgi:hypothetical protein
MIASNKVMIDKMKMTFTTISLEFYFPSLTWPYQRYSDDEKESSSVYPHCPSCANQFGYSTARLMHINVNSN